MNNLLLLILFVSLISILNTTFENDALFSQSISADSTLILNEETTINEPIKTLLRNPQQSRTGPNPPPEVLQRDAEKQTSTNGDIISETSLPVPAYLWRHGCGPTAVGMVIGYYDNLGYNDLIPGSSLTQTPEVDQAIASGGNQNNPFPPDSESHYEDYASPQDYWPYMLVDDYITQGREPHTDNCIADYMNTSKSTENNYYGWSWSSRIGPAFVSYIHQQNPDYSTDYQGYYFYNGTLNWSVLTSEIDSSRPMIFLVDTDANGSTDHFVTVIDYRTSPVNQYGCWDTWNTTSIRWEDFNQMSDSVAWGIWGAWKLVINTPPVQVEHSEFTPTKFELSQNYPNPFNPATTINFSLPQTNYVTLKVYNITGEEVSTLISGELSSGNFKYEWHADRLPSGVYMYKLQAGEYIATKKMLLIK